MVAGARAGGQWPGVEMTESRQIGVAGDSAAEWQHCRLNAAAGILARPGKGIFTSGTNGKEQDVMHW